MKTAKYAGGKGNVQNYLTTHLQAHMLMEKNLKFSTVFSTLHKKNLLLRGIKCAEMQVSHRGVKCPVQTEPVLSQLVKFLTV